MTDTNETPRTERDQTGGDGETPPPPYGVAWPEDGPAETDTLPSSPDEASGDQTGGDTTTTTTTTTTEETTTEQDNGNGNGDDTDGDEVEVVPPTPDSEAWRGEVLAYGIVGIVVALVVGGQLWVNGEIDTLFQVVVALYVMGVLVQVLGRDQAVAVWELVGADQYVDNPSADSDDSTSSTTSGTSTTTQTQTTTSDSRTRDAERSNYAPHSTSEYSPSEGRGGVYSE